MAKRTSRKRKLVPESQHVIDQWKYEIAEELGLAIGPSHNSNMDVEFASELGESPSFRPNRNDWGHIASRDVGIVGGNITARLIRKAQESIF